MWHSSEGHVHRALVAGQHCKGSDSEGISSARTGIQWKERGWEMPGTPPAQWLQVRPSSSQSQTREQRRAKQKQYSRSWGPGLGQVRAATSPAGQGSLRGGGLGGWTPSILGSSSSEVGRKGSASRKQRLSWSNSYRKKHSLQSFWNCVTASEWTRSPFIGTRCSLRPAVRTAHGLQWATKSAGKTCWVLCHFHYLRRVVSWLCQYAEA